MTLVSMPRAAVRPSVEKRAETGAFSLSRTASASSCVWAWPVAYMRQHARQRADFHRRFVPARRLEPGVFSLDIQMLVRRLGAGVS